MIFIIHLPFSIICFFLNGQIKKLRLPLFCQLNGLKPTVAILFALLIVSQTMNRVWLVVSYQLNRDYIAQHFCVNQAKPELQCHGACHLKAQLAQEEARDQLPGPLKPQFEVTFFLPTQVSPSVVLVFDYQLITSIYPPLCPGLPQGWAGGVFHPPC
jgi:hypothetical protein